MFEPTDDPVLKEVREARERLLEAHGGSLRALAEAMQKLDQEQGGTVDFSKEKPRPGDDSAGSSESAA